jgi:hypothetical protein
MNLTRSLGHENISNKYIDNPFDYCKIRYTTPIKIIIGSDGLWDMVHKNDISSFKHFSDATEVGNWALERWNNTWNVEINGKKYNNSFEKDNIDDICIGMFIN